jgi:DNA-binding transcriptional MocR family regulator
LETKWTKIDATTLARMLGDAHWHARRGPLSVRLSEAIAAVVQSGELLSGTKVPSERALAAALALSRNTVGAAYELLAADGYLESRRSSGSWIRLAGSAAAQRVTAGGPSVPFPSPSDSGGEIDFCVGDVQLREPFYHYVAAHSARELAELGRQHAYDPHGLPALRTAIAEYYCARGLPTAPDEILITSGGQHGIALVTQLSIDRGDAIAVENPTFFIAADSFRHAGARLSALPDATQGERLRDSLVHGGVRLVYVIPNNHNPLGTNMPKATRKLLAQSASALGVTILEDGTLEELSYDGRVEAPLAMLAPDACASIGSLNKLFWSGLRIGWIRANQASIERLAKLKILNDLGSTLYAQSVAVRVMRDLDTIRAHRRAELRRKLERTVDLLERHLPSWSFEVPSGGFCLWLKLPVADARPYVQLALRAGVKIASGTSMTIDGSCADHVRLVFSGAAEHTHEGIVRLARAWQVFLSRGAARDEMRQSLVV